MFEEVKEMIDSTIYTNGRGEVTAQNVNLAMHGIVDANEEKFDEVGDAVKAVEDKVTALEENGTGGGSCALRVWINEENTPEQIAENVATYSTIKQNGLQSVALEYIDSENGETYESFFAPIETVVVSSSDGDYIYFKCIVDVKNGLSVVSEILLYEDGSIEY